MADPGTAELQLGIVMTNPGTAKLQLGIAMADPGNAELQLGIHARHRPSNNARINTTAMKPHTTHSPIAQECYRPPMPCFMCSLDPDRIVAENELAAAIRDGFPVSPGHTLVITKRHAETWFDATAEERSAVLELVDEVKRALDEELHPDGFNIGINVGEAAGQTVPHLHVHVIPRFAGDVDDPTGGVRLAIPDKGNYRHPGFVPSSSDAG